MQWNTQCGSLNGNLIYIMNHVSLHGIVSTFNESLLVQPPQANYWARVKEAKARGDELIIG